MKKNINIQKNKIPTLKLIFISIFLIGISSLFIINNNIFSITKVEGVAPVDATTTDLDADGNCRNGSNNPTNCALTKTSTSSSPICKNGTIDPPYCTKNTGSCKYGGTFPDNCTILSSSGKYLKMAAAGQALTAGIVETDMNVTDATRKYLTSISDTETALKELRAIQIAYNAIIKVAQASRSTSTNQKCTFSELSN